MLLRPSNLLLLDEPTNHLDLFSKEVLLDALKGFDGTVVFVSHDRYFVNSLATRIVEVENGGLENYYGDYEYYLEKKGQGSGVKGQEHVKYQKPAPCPLPLVPEAKSREEQKRLKREDQAREKQQQAIEKEIAALEQQISDLEAEMNGPGFFDDAERGLKAGERHNALNARLDELYGQWEASGG